MPAACAVTPSNAVLLRYIRDLARVRIDLAVMQAGENESRDQAVVELDAFNHLVPSRPALLGVSAESAQMHGVGTPASDSQSHLHSPRSLDIVAVNRRW